MVDDLVTIREYECLPEAEAARMHLRAAGIQAVLTDAEAVSMDWVLGNALGYIKLQVPRTKAQAALAALAVGASTRRSRKKKRRRRGEEECLACGAALRREQSRCAACGWSYLAEGESPQVGEPAETEGRGSGPTEGASTLEFLRALKRPVLMLWLAPILVMLAIGALGMLALGWLSLPTGR
jgi:hypothetical protein